MLEEMKYYTIKGVAQILDVSITTVHRLIKDGALAAYQINARGPWRIDEEVLKQFLQDMKKGGVK